MKTYNTYFSNEQKLKQFLVDNNIIDDSKVLIQAFTGVTDLDYISNLLKSLKFLLPSAKIIGASTDGEISNGEVSTGKTTLSFTIFDNVQIKTALIHKQPDKCSGATLAETLFSKNSKVLITFTDGLITNAENFLSGIEKVNPDIVIAGGKAGDNAVYMATYIFSDEGISTHGAVGAVLNSETLHVHTDYSLNWKSLGKEMTVTKAYRNKVYRLGDKSAYDTYAHFLGENMAQQIPDVGIEFPLIVERNGVKVARIITGKEKDGSLTFGGNLYEGEKVRIGFGKVEMILANSYKTLENFNDKPIESIFIYSCMARRRFMPNSIGSETEPLQRVAPTAGFFTYGEFYNGKSKELLNQTMTILALSESSVPVRVSPNQLIETKYSEGATEVLSRLIDTTTNELLEANNRLNTAIEASGEGLWEWNTEKETVYFSPIWKNIIGYKDHELENTFCAWTKNIHSEDKKEFFDSLTNCINGEIDNISFEHRIMHKNGHWVWVKCRGKVFLDKAGEVAGVSGFYSDLSREKEAKTQIDQQSRKLLYQSQHDALTGLKNRDYFYNTVNQKIEKSKNTHLKLAIIFIDLDGFKKINDTMGHDIGDKLLIKISEILAKKVKKHDLVARLAGDEFVVLLSDILNEEKSIHDCLNSIIEAMQIDTLIDEQRVKVSASVGVAVYPNDGNTADKLLINADIAMYKSKESGKNTYHFYDHTMGDELRHKLTLEKDIEKGIYNKEFTVYYQPQFDAKTNLQVGMEALIRWDSPTRGLVFPGEFIPLAEETGLIIELDKQTMKTAITQVAQWQTQGLNSGFVSLNLSINQLEDKEFVLFLSKTIEETRCPPSCVEIEITERQIMKDTNNAIKTLQKIRDLGVLISIDDFGTGHSSLSYLTKLPINKVKIDQSFVQNVPHSNDDIVIVNAIISIANNLNFSTVAEGVEFQEQKDFIKESGCSIIQGYYYSKAISAEEMTEKLIHLKQITNKRKLNLSSN